MVHSIFFRYRVHTSQYIDLCIWVELLKNGHILCITPLTESEFSALALQAWIEALTKGAVLVFTASEVETATLAAGINPGFAGLLGGMTGGIAQAYATMGE